MPGRSELTGGIALGFLAVLCIAFLVGCCSLIIPYGVPRRPDDIEATLLIGFVAAMVTFPFALVSALAIGVPMFRFLHRRGAQSVLPYLTAGVLMSAILGTAVSVAHRLVDFLDGGDDFCIALWIIAIGGPVAALIVRYVSGARI